ncbi:MAG: mandelate racemase/muconate lactonizing enzyme family protein [Caldilineaceae bacterium]|nr:mandelate racemase/muconate lactonizing enzyme family protein [Caldilineaceae bacterium]
MKITALKTYLVDSGSAKHWLFVKVETDEGLYGWGEAYTQLDRDRQLEVQIQELARYVEGRNPFDIKHFCFMAYNDFAGKRGSLELFCAISAIEQALWDIAGKAANQPVYNLLGGAFRQKIRVYANGWGGGGTPEQAAEAAAATVAKGFTGLKFDPFPGPWRAWIDKSEEAEAVARVAAVREAVGPEVEILVEVHRRLAPLHAIRVARLLEPYRPYWYEEPVSAQDLDGLAEVRRNISLPVVTGEELYTKNDFRPVFEKRAADILNPDVCNCGGILELREIGAMAEAYHVAIAPHGYNSTAVGLAAMLHGVAAMPNFLIGEYFVNFEKLSNTYNRTPIVAKESYVALPTGPGLGVDMDEEALAAHAYQQRPMRKLRTPAEE